MEENLKNWKVKFDERGFRMVNRCCVVKRVVM